MTKEEAYKKMTTLCSTGERCRAELNEKMVRWGMAYQDINEILDNLEKEDYLNEERFCRAFVHDKFLFEKWGRIKIGQALQLKKIPASVYRRFLSEIDEDEYAEVLRALLKSKTRSLRADSAFEMKAKLIRFAQSRGFEMRVISNCIEIPDELYGVNEDDD